MAKGFNIKVPLSVNSIDGPYVLTKTFNENAKQNVKMIILTEKGEKLSDINFGCGLKKYLFEQPNSDMGFRVEDDIRTQLGTYASYVKINEIKTKFDPEGQYLAVLLNYTIPITNTSIEDIFEVAA